MDGVASSEKTDSPVEFELLRGEGRTPGLTGHYSPTPHTIGD
jgi:hypothetical protein